MKKHIIKFDTPNFFTGRNGHFIATALLITQIDADVNISFQPITSKKQTANCEIQFPIAQLPNLIETLQHLHQNTAIIYGLLKESVTDSNGNLIAENETPVEIIKSFDEQNYAVKHIETKSHFVTAKTNIIPITTKNTCLDQNCSICPRD